MTTIDRDLLKSLRTDINQALAAVAKKHKLIIAAGNASFNESSATFKLLVNVPADGQSIVGATAADIRAAKAATDWKLAKSYGCEPKWLGKKYSSGGKTFTVKGLLPSRSKNCVLICDQKGQSFATTPDTVRAGISAKSAVRR